MAKRTDLLEQFAREVGHSLVSVVEERDGWPSICRLELQGESLLVALHIGRVQETHRHRPWERRIQNPAKERSLFTPLGTFPLVVGVWTEESEVAEERKVAFVGMDAVLRMERASRASMFMPLRLLQQGKDFGWAEHVNRDGELIVGFKPVLLPAYVEMRRSGLPLLSEEVGRAFETSGLLLPESSIRKARERRLSMVLERSTRFSRVVIDAYDGRCAMCGVGFKLLEGAHIYPVMAPDAPDEIWNGLALCGNHHKAFDRHLIWVNPASMAIKLHYSLAEDLEGPASRSFVELTYPKLHRPSNSAHHPNSEMFKKRYDFFSGLYAWARKRS